LAILTLIALLQAGAPPSSAWERFPVFVWRQDHKDEVPLELVAGLGGVNVERDADAEDVFEHGIDFYVGHGPGRDELHLERDSPGYLPMWRRWYRERDDETLVRPPCLTDPATRTTLFETLARTLEARGGRHGVGVSLGDEVSLTPWGDPLDLCHSRTCRAGFEPWCRERFGRAWPWVGTDRVRLAWTAGDATSTPAWLARREYHHDVLCELLEELATRARAHPSSPAIGLLGLAGRTAFGNVAVDRALAFCNFVEPYPTVDARELAFTLRRDDQRVLRTIFPDERGPDGVARDVWDHWMRGGDGIVVWSDRVLARRPAVRERLVEVVASIRALQRELGPYRPRPAGVALVHDDRSIALRFLRDALLDGPTWPKRFGGYQLEHGKWERDVVRWLRLFEQVGAMPGALPLQRVDARTVRRFPLLLLNHVEVVDDAGRERLRAYLDAGGHVVVHGALGLVDPARGRRETALADELEERFPTRVTVLAPTESPPDEPARSERWRKRVRGWLTDAGVPEPPSPGPDVRPALTTWMDGGPSGRIRAYLPAPGDDVARLLRACTERGAKTDGRNPEADTAHVRSFAGGPVIVVGPK